MRFSFILISLLIWLPVQAHDVDDSSCSDWKARRGITCIFAGRDADSWERTCTDETQLCKYKQYSQCLKERVCSLTDPNLLSAEMPCTNWVRERGISCYNKKTKDWEQSHKRSCTVANLEEQLCSDNP